MLPARVPLHSRRITPRQRHDVSSAVLTLSRPLFRYCPWRDAWILRGIGERFGPVLRVAGRRTRTGAAPAVPGAHRLSTPSWALEARSRSAALRSRGALVAGLTLAAILAAVALGSLIVAGSGHRQSLPALDRHVSAGVLQVSVPSSWRRRPPPAISHLGLADELAMAPAASGGGVLVLGRAATTEPDLLPQGLLASLPAAARPQIVRLARTSFYRYLNLSSRGAYASESIYAVPTTVGTVLGVCLPGKVDQGFTGSCERSLGTLRLASGTVLAPGPSPSYARALTAVIERLNTARHGVGSQLLAARTRRTQARAADELATAHTEAAAALVHLNAGSSSGPNSAMAAALKATGQAYGALGRAAAADNARHYRGASAALARATKTLNSAVARLSALGYRLS